MKVRPPPSGSEPLPSLPVTSLPSQGDGAHKDWSGASALYREALALCPDGAQAHNNLAVVEALRGDLLAAVFRYVRAQAVPEPFALAAKNLRHLADGRLRVAAGVTNGAGGGGGEGPAAAGERWRAAAGAFAWAAALVVCDPPLSGSEESTAADALQAVGAFGARLGDLLRPQSPAQSQAEAEAQALAGSHFGGGWGEAGGKRAQWEALRRGRTPWEPGPGAAQLLGARPGGPSGALQMLAVAAFASGSAAAGLPLGPEPPKEALARRASAARALLFATAAAVLRLASAEARARAAAAAGGRRADPLPGQLSALPAAAAFLEWAYASGAAALAAPPVGAGHLEGAERAAAWAAAASLLNRLADANPEATAGAFCRSASRYKTHHSQRLDSPFSVLFSLALASTFPQRLSGSPRSPPPVAPPPSPPRRRSPRSTRTSS